MCVYVCVCMCMYIVCVVYLCVYVCACVCCVCSSYNFCCKVTKFVILRLFSFSIAICQFFNFIEVYSEDLVNPRVYNNKSVQLPWGFHYHHLGSMTLVISGEYVHICT